MQFERLSILSCSADLVILVEACSFFRLFFFCLFVNAQIEMLKHISYLRTRSWMDLFLGSMDPYTRMSRSPKLKSQSKMQFNDGQAQGLPTEESRNSVADQVENHFKFLSNLYFVKFWSHLVFFSF